MQGGSAVTEHMLLLSGYGAPECDDLVVCHLKPDGTFQTIAAMRHGRAPSFCCQGSNGWIYVASERQDGADITAYVFENNTLQEKASLEIPGGQALCHLYPYGEVIYGSCFGNGMFFAVSSDLTRILWQFQPSGANAHWAQAIGNMLYLADLGNDCLYRFPLQNDLPTGDGAVLTQPMESGPRQVLDTGNSTLTCVYELDGSVRLLNFEGEAVFATQASARSTPRNWPGGAGIAEGGTLLVCNRGPNTISALQRDDAQYKLLCEWPTGDWPRYLCTIPGTSYLLVACQREGAVHCYDYTSKSHLPKETAFVNLPGASCALLLR